MEGQPTKRRGKISVNLRNAAKDMRLWIFGTALGVGIRGGVLLVAIVKGVSQLPHHLARESDPIRGISFESSHGLVLAYDRKLPDWWVLDCLGHFCSTSLNPFANNLTVAGIGPAGRTTLTPRWSSRSRSSIRKKPTVMTRTWCRCWAGGFRFMCSSGPDLTTRNRRQIHGSHRTTLNTESNWNHQYVLEYWRRFQIACILLLRNCILYTSELWAVQNCVPPLPSISASAVQSWPESGGQVQRGNDGLFFVVNLRHLNVR